MQSNVSSVDNYATKNYSYDLNTVIKSNGKSVVASQQMVSKPSNNPNTRPDP